MLILEQTMLTFVACICGAGILLSLVARYPALLVLVAILAALTVAADLQGWRPVPRLGSLPLTVLIEVVAIQVGYAIGVLGRSALGARRAAEPAPRPEINVRRPNGA